MGGLGCRLVAEQGQCDAAGEVQDRPMGGPVTWLHQCQGSVSGLQRVLRLAQLAGRMRQSMTHSHRVLGAPQGVQQGLGTLQ